MLERFRGFLRGRGWMVGAALVLLAIVVTGAIVFDGLDVSAIIRRYGDISERVIAHPVLAFLIATGIYTALVVLLLPGVPLLSIPVGLILGWGMAILVTMSATALGISILYALTIWILPERFGRGRAGMMDKLARGLREDAVGYMMFLRLMPPVPFTVLNVALPALRVPYVQFLFTTLAGMLPRLAAYCFAGEGLRGVIDERVRACAAQVPACQPDFALADFVTMEIVAATGLLALVSLAPIVFKRLSARHPDR